MRLIDADAVLKHFTEYWAMQEKLKRPSKQQYAQYMTMRSIVNSFKTEDAVPVVHGRWIEEPNCWYQCSICGDHYPSIRGFMEYRHCPHCGAKMDGAERKEE